MNKIAQIRNQEIRGTVAALVDAGLVKCASNEEFDVIANAVNEKLANNAYDLADIVEATSLVVEGPAVKTAEEAPVMYKEAALQHESNCFAALGELLLMKTAGQISDEDFVSEADFLMKAAAEAAGINEAISELPEEVQEAVLEALIEEALAAEAAPAE